MPTRECVQSSQAMTRHGDYEHCRYSDAKIQGKWYLNPM